MKKALLILLMISISMSALVVYGCDDREPISNESAEIDKDIDDGDDSWQLYQDAETPVDILSEQFVSQAKSLLGGAYSDYGQFELFLMDVSLFYRVVDVPDKTSDSIVVTSVLQGSISEESLFTVYLEESCNVYVNGKKAALNDVKPGYLVSFAPCVWEQDQNLDSCAGDGAAGENKVFVNAWVANQD